MIFSVGGDPSPVEELKYIFMHIPCRNQDLASRLQHHLVSLLVLYHLPSLISNCLDLPFESQRRLRMLNKVYILQTRMVNYMTLLTFCQNGTYDCLSLENRH